jgi:dTDP-glucose 4,6-dehydratase
MNAERTLLVTGGAGFIGTNLVHLLAAERPSWRIVVADRLSYAATTVGLQPLLSDGRVVLERIDIADPVEVGRVFDEWQPSGVFHLAAESHVDRSIEGPRAFLHSNVNGTFELLEAARARWGESGTQGRFLHVSTDEVYGSLGAEGVFREDTPYDPSSPYSATKAASDHLVRAWHRTFGLDVVLTNCSNNYGPWQYPEKLIPVIIRAIRDERPLPVYGDGSNVRDWLHVEDHVRALLAVFERGTSGRSYNVGARNEWTNLQLVEWLCDRVDDRLGRPRVSRSRITFVRDRPGHDLRYAIDPSRLESELSWSARVPFDEGLDRTVAWYLETLSSVWPNL